jgi:hypothetical protein
MGAPSKAAALKPGNERQPPPGQLVPITYRPPNSLAHHVSDGERWETVASRYGVPVKELIWENFKTHVPEEINWYLKNYVRCDTPTPDGYNWRFSTSAQNGGGPRAGIIFVPQKANASNGADQLAKDMEELQATLKEIQASIKEGQQALNELSCAIATEAFKRRGVGTNHSLRYLGPDVGLLLHFIECLIITSRSIGPFVSGHPNASHSNPSSPIGDLATLRIHADYHFQDALANEGITVDGNTRGLFDPSTRSIHLPDTATFGQALHEGIHSFSAAKREQPVFQTVFGSFLYEGITQLFTDMVLADHTWDKATRHSYDEELRCAARFTSDFLMTPVANAYFRRQVVPLAEAVARRLRINLGELRRIILRKDNNNRRRGHVLCERLGYIN